MFKRLAGDFWAIRDGVDQAKCGRLAEDHADAGAEDFFNAFVEFDCGKCAVVFPVRVRDAADADLFFCRLFPATFFSATRASLAGVRFPFRHAARFSHQLPLRTCCAGAESFLIFGCMEKRPTTARRASKKAAMAPAGGGKVFSALRRRRCMVKT